MTLQPQPLADRIAAAMAGHTANISNGDGTVICNCGTTVGANPAAWREHRATTVLAVVQPELDQRDTEIARLREQVEDAHCRLHLIQRRIDGVDVRDDPTGITGDIGPWIDGPLHPTHLTAYRTTRES
jgi:hypothetical protein